MNTYNMLAQITRSELGYIAAFAVIGTLLLLGYFEITSRLRRQNEKMLMDQTAKDMLEARGHKTRQRFVDDDTMEYLYLVLGTKSKGGENLIWTIVRVGRETVGVTIHHLDLDLLPETSRQMVNDTVGDLAASLKKRGCLAKVEVAKEQPDLDRLGVYN